jgi:hypothetical protein
VKWVIRDIERHPELFEDYGKNKGIIATRERFLKFLEGKDVGEVADQGEEEEAREFGKTVIVPIAIPGCGEFTASSRWVFQNVDFVFEQVKRRCRLRSLTFSAGGTRRAMTSKQRRLGPSSSRMSSVYCTTTTS